MAGLTSQSIETSYQNRITALDAKKQAILESSQQQLEAARLQAQRTNPNKSTWQAIKTGISIQTREKIDRLTPKYKAAAESRQLAYTAMRQHQGLIQADKTTAAHQDIKSQARIKTARFAREHPEQAQTMSQAAMETQFRQPTIVESRELRKEAAIQRRTAAQDEARAKAYQQSKWREQPLGAQKVEMQPVTFSEWMEKQPEGKSGEYYIRRSRKLGLTPEQTKSEILYREETLEKKQAQVYGGYDVTRNIYSQQRKVGTYDYEKPLTTIPSKTVPLTSKELITLGVQEKSPVMVGKGIIKPGLDIYNRGEARASKFVKSKLTESGMMRLTSKPGTVPTVIEEQLGMSLPRPTSAKVFLEQIKPKTSYESDYAAVSRGATKWLLPKFREKPITTAVVVPAALYGGGKIIGVAGGMISSINVAGATVMDTVFKGGMIYWGATTSKKFYDISKEAKTGKITREQMMEKVGGQLAEESYYAVPIITGASSGTKTAIKWGFDPKPSALPKLTFRETTATPYSEALKETPEGKVIYREIGYRFGLPKKGAYGWETSWKAGPLAWQGMGRVGIGEAGIKSFPISKLTKLFPTTTRVPALEYQTMIGKSQRGVTITAKPTILKAPKYKYVKGYEQFMLSQPETVGQLKLYGKIASQASATSRVQAMEQYQAINQIIKSDILPAGRTVRPKATDRIVSYPENFPAKTTYRAGEKYFKGLKNIWGGQVTYQYGASWDVIYLSPLRAKTISVHDVDKMLRLSLGKTEIAVEGVLQPLKKTGANVFIPKDTGLVMAKGKGGVKQLYDTHSMLEYGSDAPREFASIPFTQPSVEFQGEVGMGLGEGTFRRIASSAGLHVTPAGDVRFGPALDRGKDIYRGAQFLAEIGETTGAQDVKSAAKTFSKAFDAPSYAKMGGEPKSIPSSIPIPPKFVGGLNVIAPRDYKIDVKRVTSPSAKQIAGINLVTPKSVKVDIKRVGVPSGPMYYIKPSPVISSPAIPVAPPVISAILRSRSRRSVPSRTSLPSVSSVSKMISKPSLPSKVSLPSSLSIPSSPSIPSLPYSLSIPYSVSLPYSISLPSSPSIPSSPSVPSIPRVPPGIPGGGWIPAGIPGLYGARRKPGPARARKYSPSVKAFYEKIKAPKGSKTKFEKMIGLTGLEVRPLITSQKNIKII